MRIEIDGDMYLTGDIEQEIEEGSVTREQVLEALGTEIRECEDATKRMQEQMEEISKSIEIVDRAKREARNAYEEITGEEW